MRRAETSKAFRSAIVLWLGINAGAVAFAHNAVAEEAKSPPTPSHVDPALLQLAQLTVQKGFKNISLGDVCDRLHIGANCKAYQLNATIEPDEAQKFGLLAGWHTSLNVLVQPHGANVVVTDHDDHVGYAYLIGADEGLRAVLVGLSASGDGRNWRWRPGPLNDDTTRKFAAEKTYWLAQVKAIQTLPDRKD